MKKKRRGGGVRKRTVYLNSRYYEVRSFFVALLHQVADRTKTARHGEWAIVTGRKEGGKKKRKKKKKKVTASLYFGIDD